MNANHIDAAGPTVTGRTQLNLWYCAACEAVHLNAGRVRLTFDRSEFALFLQTAIETHYTSIESLEGLRMMSADHVDIESKQTTAAMEFLH